MLSLNQTFAPRHESAKSLYLDGLPFHCLPNACAGCGQEDGDGDTERVNF